MNALFDKLNLRPAERRLVMIVALVVFLVVNAFLVWPRFFEWGKVTNQTKSAQMMKDQYDAEIKKVPEYQRKLAELANKGAHVGNEDEALKLSTTVHSQAALSGVTVNNYTAVPKTASTGGKTNTFFDEQSATIQFIAEERSLVDFLYNLGAGGSMIRVRTMTLNPDAPRYKLQGSITLVASYQRTTPARAVTAPAAPASASLRPAAPAARGTNAPARTATVSNAPPQKVSWWSRLWPFGKKNAPTTNAPAKANPVVKTNPAAAGPKK